MAPTQQTFAILASLQTDVLNAQKSKIDFSDITDKPNMDTLKQQLGLFLIDLNNHTPEGLEIFKDFEKTVADTRRTLAASVSKLEKEKKKQKREADKQAAKDLAKAKSEDPVVTPAPVVPCLALEISMAQLNLKQEQEEADAAAAADVVFPAPHLRDLLSRALERLVRRLHRDIAR